MLLTRRNLLLLALASIAARLRPVALAQEGPAEGFDLQRFMAVSRVLTGMQDLADASSGRLYLAALLNRPNGASLLNELWRTGGFGGPKPPTSVADLAAAGVYENAELRRLADTITADWYSGVYATPDGGQAVATYTNALAWRSLGYRVGGPSTCGGAFGHWVRAPEI